MSFMLNSHFRLHDVARQFNPSPHPLSQEQASSWSFKIKQEYERLRDSSRKAVYEYCRDGHIKQKLVQIGESDNNRRSIKIVLAGSAALFVLFKFMPRSNKPAEPAVLHEASSNPMVEMRIKMMQLEIDKLRLELEVE